MPPERAGGTQVVPRMLSFALSRRLLRAFFLGRGLSMEEYVVETRVDRRAMTALARAARKTLRRRRSRRVHTFGLLVTVFLLMVAVGGRLAGEERWWLNLLLALLMMAVTQSEDIINGLIGLRQVPGGSREVTAAFDGTRYIHRTQTAETRWSYDRVQTVCETGEYFVFLLDDHHGQIYAKSGFTRGTPMAFREFITRKTGKPVQNIQ